jgi:hypothetical protein
MNMNSSKLENVNKILKSGLKRPIIIEDINVESFNGAVVIDAKIEREKVAVLPTNNGFQIPEWINQLKLKKEQNQRLVLVINCLDSVDKLEQEKFYELLKFNGVSGLLLPENTKIIITIKKGGFEKISRRIQSLCLFYKG